MEKLRLDLRLPPPPLMGTLTNVKLYTDKSKINPLATDDTYSGDGGQITANDHFIHQGRGCYLQVYFSGYKTLMET